MHVSEGGEDSHFQCVTDSGHRMRRCSIQETESGQILTRSCRQRCLAALLKGQDGEPMRASMALETAWAGERGRG